MTTVETKANIKEATRTLADRLKAELTVDAATGVGTFAPETFANNLPEGLTMDHVEAVYGYQDQLVAAGALAVGESAIPVLEKAGETSRVTATLSTTGKNYIGYAFDRSRQVPTRNEDGTTGTREKFGSMTVDIVTYGTKNRGQLAQVKNELSEMALAAFGSKK